VQPELDAGLEAELVGHDLVELRVDMQPEGTIGGEPLIHFAQAFEGFPGQPPYEAMALFVCDAIHIEDEAAGRQPAQASIALDEHGATAQPSRSRRRDEPGRAAADD